MKLFSPALALLAGLFLLSACSGDDDGGGMVDDMGMMDVDMGMSDADMGTTETDMGIDDPTCFGQGFGVGCTTAMGCRIGTCQPTLNFVEFGGDEDPIDDLPSGENGIPGGELYTGGFCTIDTLTEGTPDCLENDGICGDCMTCINAFGGGACYLNCDPAAAGNDICPDGWACLGLNNGGGVCFDGCQTDVDCWANAVIREETNGIPGFQTGDDCANVPSPCGFAGPDQLRFIPSGNPTCNPDTFQCELDGDPTAQAGDMCGGDVQCEDGGNCQDERSFDLIDGEYRIFVGGYCFGPTCESAADCNGDAVCGGARSDVWTDFTPTCLEGCDLTAGVDAMDPATWPTGRGGCSEGFKCLSDADGDNPELGVCVLDRVDPLSENGTFTQAFGSGPTEPNFGALCTVDTDCFNPFGYGDCVIGFNGRDGYCTVEEAAVLEASGFDVCPEETGVVVATSEAPELASTCLLACDTPADCPVGFGCLPDADGGTSFCAAVGCEDSTQCRADAECIAGACFLPCTNGDSCDDGFGCLPLNSIFDVEPTDNVCFDVCANDDQCPRDQVCAGETAEVLGQCINECLDATECAEGEACVDFDGASGGERECQANCVEDADCRTGEVCDEETEVCTAVPEP
ncbi:MAG: hypothetical protein AAGH15_20710 [Myxococcota bacterium]